MAGPGSAVVRALVENHRRFLSFLERRVGDRAAAEDILQAAFVRGVEKAGDLRDEERAVAWFYTLLRNALADHWRSRAAEERGREALARGPGAEAGSEPELQAEVCRCFEALLPTLPESQAAILRRVDLEEARPVDVARELGISSNLAMVRLHRARRGLRRRLMESCKSCAEHGCLDCTCAPRSEGGM